VLAQIISRIRGPLAATKPSTPTRRSRLTSPSWPGDDRFDPAMTGLGVLLLVLSRKRRQVE